MSTVSFLAQLDLGLLGSRSPFLKKLIRCEVVSINISIMPIVIIISAIIIPTCIY